MSKLHSFTKEKIKGMYCLAWNQPAAPAMPVVGWLLFLSLQSMSELWGQGQGAVGGSQPLRTPQGLPPHTPPPSWLNPKWPHEMGAINLSRVCAWSPEPLCTSQHLGSSFGCRRGSFWDGQARGRGTNDLWTTVQTFFFPICFTS